MNTVHKQLIYVAYAVFLSASPATGGDLPDPKLTPGDTYPTITKEIICSPTFHTKALRSVRSDTKKKVYKAYGLDSDEPPCPCEMDHLIPLSLGGSNRRSNLWPQSEITEPWNSHRKDKLENKLHNEVCTGKVELEAAQQEIAADWIEAYKKRFGPR